MLCISLNITCRPMTNPFCMMNGEGQNQDHVNHPSFHIPSSWHISTLDSLFVQIKQTLRSLFKLISILIQWLHFIPYRLNVGSMTSNPSWIPRCSTKKKNHEFIFFWVITKGNHASLIHSPLFQPNFLIVGLEED